MRRSTKSLILKIVVAIPLLWFCLIGISVVFTGKNLIQSSTQIKTEGPHETHKEVKVLQEQDSDILVREKPVTANIQQLEKRQADHIKHIFLGERILADEQYDVPKVERPDKNLPGEEGKPLIIDDKKLPVEEKAEFDKGWKNNAFNEYASKKISMHRNLPDVRDKELVNLQGWGRGAASTVGEVDGEVACRPEEMRRFVKSWIVVEGCRGRGAA